MVALLSQYPLRKTRDVRSAMAEALAALVRGVSFSLPKSTTPFSFAAVYDTWATFQNTATSAGGKLPAAAVLPDRPVYEAASLTPRMIDDTWSGGPVVTPAEIQAGAAPTLGTGAGDGFALFAIAEVVVPFVLVVRGSSIPIRKAIVSQLEDLFVEDQSLPDPSSVNPRTLPKTGGPGIEPPDASVQPVRYGRLLTLPSYYNRKARFTLLSQQILDSEESALGNRWLAQFEIQGHCQVVVLRRVKAMSPRLQTVLNGQVDQRGFAQGSS